MKHSHIMLLFRINWLGSLFTLCTFLSFVAPILYNFYVRYNTVRDLPRDLVVFDLQPWMSVALCVGKYELLIGRMMNPMVSIFYWHRRRPSRSLERWLSTAHCKRKIQNWIICNQSLVVLDNQQQKSKCFGQNLEFHTIWLHVELRNMQMVYTSLINGNR